MTYMFLLLAQLIAPANAPATTTMLLDAEREVVLTLGADGAPVAAVIRRFDGKPMTCDTYFAAFSQTYTCNGNCATAMTASASRTSNFSRAEACEAARADACAAATCTSGTYQLCTQNYRYSLWNGNTGSCTYSVRLACEVTEECSLE